mgnify:CR=1 FL=1
MHQHCQPMHCMEVHSVFVWLPIIHISEPTRLRRISYAVFCLKKKKTQKKNKQQNNMTFQHYAYNHTTAYPHILHLHTLYKTIPNLITH